MAMLSLDLFTAARDEEAARYRILAGVQEARRAFARNEVYPYLADLIRLTETLHRVTEAADAVRDRQRGPLRGLDLEQGRLLYDAAEERMLLAESLIRWALPLLGEAVEEGRVLYDFAEAHAALSPLGIVPSYQGEGYLLVPTKGWTRILRYTVSLFDQPDGRYRSLRTTEAAAVPSDVLTTDLKRRLAAHDPQLPNPAAYRVESGVDLPVEATVLPVAKRKLLQYLALGGTPGAA